MITSIIGIGTAPSEIITDTIAFANVVVDAII